MPTPSAPPKNIVLDTSVLVAAARSRQGASFELLSSISSREFKICLSVSLYAEWQAVLTRTENIPPGLTVGSVQGYLRYLVSVAHLQAIHFLWRPYLPDPNDDMVLELAVAAGCRHVVTHNMRDFKGSERLGVQAITPGNYLQLIRRP